MWEILVRGREFPNTDFVCFGVVCLSLQNIAEHVALRHQQWMLPTSQHMFSHKKSFSPARALYVHYILTSLSASAF